RVLAHPECRADVQALADAVLSTSGMVRYAKESAEREFLVVTECGLSDRLLLEVPGKKFYKSCKLCHYMKMITLEGTRDALRDLAARTGVRHVYLEQLYTFGSPHRDPHARVVSVAYFALIPHGGRFQGGRRTPKYADVAWCPVAHLPRLAYDHRAVVTTALARLRAKLTYTN